MDRLLAALPASTFHEWMAFDDVEPLAVGPYLRDMLARLDWAQQQLAVNNLILANVNRDRERRPYPYELSDFLPHAESSPAEPQDIWRMLKTWALMNQMGQGQREMKQ